MGRSREIALATGINCRNEIQKSIVSFSNLQFFDSWATPANDHLKGCNHFKGRSILFSHLRSLFIILSAIQSAKSAEIQQAHAGGF